MGQRLTDWFWLNRPDEPCSFLAAAKEHQRWPKLHAKRAPKATTARVGNLDMPEPGMSRERCMKKGLHTAAMATPWAPKF